MPRIARVVIPDQAHHITQRGNNQQPVFFSDHDRAVYVRLLREYTAEYAVQVLGYCLMTNHIHVIATPRDRFGLSKALGRTHNDYARWLNIQHRKSGHVWQNRFFSCPLEKAYLWAALAYVERNPVRAGMVARAEQWPWGSAQSHTAECAPADWLDDTLWKQDWTPTLWRVLLEEGVAEANIRARIYEATRTGRPMGDHDFLQQCEIGTGTRLRRGKPGPSRKAPASDQMASTGD
jgi:putative transposase